jgi:nucleoid-associated protein YgaU
LECCKPRAKNACRLYKKPLFLEDFFKRDDVMKKLSVLMAAMLAVSGSVMAQAEDSAGATGSVAAGTVAASAVAAAALAAVIANAREEKARDLVVDPEAQCVGDDPLVGEFCVGSTIFVSGTGTNTRTVPVTFTYAPNIVTN